ncbi:MAG TPA: hypothetical protein VEU29_00365 [Actinomycetota bacterium]|nr:hypothetical protein [Actinomycetota bacterium]
MTRRKGRQGGRARHAAVVTLLTLASVGAGAAQAQTVLNPASGAAAPGGIVSTNVEGAACPWALVPPHVSYLRTPAVCSASVAAYTLEFSVAPGAPLGDQPIEIFECGSPPCAPSGQTFTLTIDPPASPPPTPTPASDSEEEETPPVATPKEAFLDARLALLKKEVADDAEAMFDRVDELREGEEHRFTLALDVPDELVTQLRGDQLFGGGSIYVTHVVTARLEGEGFEIRSSSDRSQGARNGAWEWRVRPVGSGSRELALTITMTMNGEGVDRTRERYVARPYEVGANLPYKIQRFFAAYWQWVIGTAITLGLAYAGMRKKKSAPPQAAGPPPA